ncbi:MAG: DUF5680 domain-containing protein [Candidatus Pacebacteria bacterium]|nr:DUF5680 domain-containing protein [Candidatus Paceibacterota bacterium]
MHDVQEAFFQAMLAGWANNAKKSQIEGLPNAKAIMSEKDGFKVADIYFTTPFSDLSTGSTIIWHLDLPVWIMSYEGRYEQIVIPFLMECLREAYSKHLFFGGRGPAFVQGDLFTYTNRFEYNEFGKFSGVEQIHDNQTGRCLGYHRYHGLSLMR